MASNQGNYDNSANAPYWAGSSVHLPQNDANVALLYGNTSPNVFFSNVTVGLFAVDDNEIGVQGYGTPGWVLRTVGQGGRAGRVQQETLSVVSSFKSDNNSDDALYPDTSVVVTTQPVSVQYVRANTSNANVVSITTAVTYKPTSAALTYLWQYNSDDGATGWTTLLNGVNGSFQNTTITGNTSATLTIAPSSNFSCNTAVFRALITATPPAGTLNATATTVNTANGKVIVFSD